MSPVGKTPAISESKVPSPLAPEPEEVRGLFNRLAGRYDKFNRLASLGLDKAWRARLVQEVLKGGPQAPILDLGTGTGDLISDLARQTAGNAPAMVGVDISLPMVLLGRHKTPGGTFWVQASAERLPFRSGSMGSLISAFTLRNLRKIMGPALAEMQRVLVPGGRLFLLEMAAPESGLIRPLHRFYLNWVLPVIGTAVFGKDWSGRYLSDTIFNFWPPDRFSAILEENGFERAEALRITGGMAVLHAARKREV